MLGKKNNHNRHNINLYFILIAYLYTGIIVFISLSKIETDSKEYFINNIGIESIIAMFSIVTMLIIDNPKIKLEIPFRILLVTLFLLTNFIYMLTFVYINYVTNQILETLIILFFSTIIITIAKSLIEKLWLSQIFTLKFGTDRIIKKLVKNKISYEEIESGLSSLDNWVNSDLSKINIEQRIKYFNLYEKLLKEIIKNEYCTKIAGNNKNDIIYNKIIDDRFSINLFRFALDPKEIQLIKSLVTMYDNIIDVLIDAYDYEKCKIFCNKLYFIGYGISLQKDKKLAEIILKSFIIRLSLFIKSKKFDNNYHSIIIEILRGILANMINYNYNIDVLTTEILYQTLIEYIENYYDQINKDDLIDKIFFILSYIINDNEFSNTIYLLKLIPLINKYENLTDKNIILQKLIKRFKSKDKQLFPLFFEVFNELYKDSKYKKEDVILLQLSICQILDDGYMLMTKMSNNEIYNYLFENNNKDKNIVEKIKNKLISFYSKENKFIIYFFKDLNNYIDNHSNLKTIYIDIQNTLFDIANDYFISNEDDDCVYVLSNIHTCCDKIFNKLFSYNNSNTDFIKAVKSYLLFIKENYTQLGTNSKQRVFNIFMNLRTKLDYEQRLTIIDYSIIFGYMAIETLDYDVIEKISNLIGWEIFNELKNIKKESASKFIYKCIKKITDFYNIITQYTDDKSSSKTSIFVATLYVVNYIYCIVRKDDIYKPIINKLDSYFKSMSKISLQCINDAINIRGKYVYDYYDFNEISIDDISIAVNHFSDSINTLIDKYSQVNTTKSLHR